MSDSKKCAAHIADKNQIVRPCRAKPSAEESGYWWCRSHLPSAEKAKEEHRNAEARAGWEVYDASKKARAARDALLQALLDAGRFDESHVPLANACAEALVVWQNAKTELAEKFGKEVI